MTGQSEVRLSLAGAQDKLPVHLEGNQVLLPIDGTPSTHILKFASPFYTHLPENETFVGMLADFAGLPVTRIVLRQTLKSRVAVVTRYDRVFAEGTYHRLHQEDFCQALGVNSARPPRACSCGAHGHQLDRPEPRVHRLAPRGWPPLAATLAGR